MLTTKKIGIIHTSNYSFSMIVANLLEEFLAEYCDLIVGLVSTMDPKIIIDEEVDTLIIGDIISNNLPNLDLLSWLKNFSFLSLKDHKQIKTIIMYCVGTPSKAYELEWQKFFQENFISVSIYSPVLYVEVIPSQYSLENHLINKIKQFSKCIVSYLYS